MTAVPRADTSIVADGIAYFCTPPDGPLVLKPGDPAYQAFGLPSPEKIIYQLAFVRNPRAECISAPAPNLVASVQPGGDIGPDYRCSQYFHDLLDGCDAGDGQDKRGGRLFTGCAIYEWMAFLPADNNIGPVLQWDPSSESSTGSRSGVPYGSSTLDRREPKVHFVSEGAEGTKFLLPKLRGRGMRAESPPIVPGIDDNSQTHEI